uniref:Uncharacterized protein n=3 Tax=Aegilops tauschii subsp. strangulata TaxID=200361 RepID=A0A453R9N5_AEGTS
LLFMDSLLLGSRLRTKWVSCRSSPASQASDCPWRRRECCRAHRPRHRSAYCDVSMPPEGLREFLPRLIQTLVSNMVYTDDDESLVDAEV